MTCKNCKKECTRNCDLNILGFQPGGMKCTCNGLGVEMVEVGKIVDFEAMYGKEGYPPTGRKTLYQCPSCKTIELK